MDRLRPGVRNTVINIVNHREVDVAFYAKRSLLALDKPPGDMHRSIRLHIHLPGCHIRPQRRPPTGSGHASPA